MKNWISEYKKKKKKSIMKNYPYICYDYFCISDKMYFDSIKLNLINVRNENENEWKENST